MNKFNKCKNNKSTCLTSMTTSINIAAMNKLGKNPNNIKYQGFRDYDLVLQFKKDLGII